MRRIRGTEDAERQLGPGEPGQEGAHARHDGRCSGALLGRGLFRGLHASHRRACRLFGDVAVPLLRRQAWSADGDLRRPQRRRRWCASAGRGVPGRRESSSSSTCSSRSRTSSVRRRQLKVVIAALINDPEMTADFGQEHDRSRRLRGAACFGGSRRRARSRRRSTWSRSQVRSSSSASRSASCSSSCSSDRRASSWPSRHRRR